MELSNWIDMGTGALVMYLLALPLLVFVSEAVDEEDTYAPLRFALLWPIISVFVTLKLMLGDEG